MKKILMKFLPIVAVILFATSCGKEEDNNSPVVENEATPAAPVQEKVEDNTPKTLVIRGKVDKGSLSKVTVESGSLKFQVGDKFSFSEEITGLYSTHETVSGTITITDPDGSYEAVLNYIDESNLTRSWGYTATHGTKLTTISGAYNSLTDAVQNAYYETRFDVVKNSDGTFALRASSNDKSDILVEVKTAFIRAECTRTIKVGGEDKEIASGKFYAVPANIQMGSSSYKTTKAGQVYTVKRLGGSIKYEIPFMNCDANYAHNKLIHVGNGKVTYSIETWPSTGVAEIDPETGAVRRLGIGRAMITATVESTDQYNYGTNNEATFHVSFVPSGYVDLNLIKVSSDGSSAQILYWKDLPQWYSNYPWYSEYFAFGSTTPCQKSDMFNTPYERVGQRAGFSGPVVLSTGFDAAYAINNLDHIPEDYDWQLLKTSCYWKWSDETGKQGYYVFAAKETEHQGSIDSKYASLYDKDIDPCIFLPVCGLKGYLYHSGGTSDAPTGYWDTDWVLTGDGTYGYFWSSSLILENGNTYASCWHIEKGKIIEFMKVHGADKDSYTGDRACRIQAVKWGSPFSL